jgi:hypothetical protein
MSRRYFGHAGHFIGAPSCRFHLHTHVHGYCVSTVGDYHPAHKPHDGPAEQIGYDRLYETMVFKLGPDDEPINWTEIEMEGYADDEEADAGHEAMVQRVERGEVRAEEEQP